MYIDFDKYPTYSYTISDFFKSNFNANIKCEYGYTYPSRKQKFCTCVNKENWEMMKICFPDTKQMKKYPKTTVWKECTYVQKDRNKIDEIFDEHTFSES